MSHMTCCPAPSRFPYAEHRTMAEVMQQERMRDNARAAFKAADRQGARA